ncbi:MAG: NAD(P)-binding domain-containing protein [Acetobacteraceae bacterium]
MHDSVLPVAVVGAGPYGLSVAAHLRGRRVPFRIFGDPMESWRTSMPRGMLLKSEGFASSLHDPAGECTLERYCRERSLPYEAVGEPVSIERFIAYGEEFQRRCVPELEGHKVRSLRSDARGFSLTTDAGETFLAKRVIVATGITHFGQVPSEFAACSPDLLSHSSAYSDLTGFRGRRVVVVGGGSSAIDIAGLLHEVGADVEVVARRLAIAFHEPTVEPRPLLKRILVPRSGLGLGWRSRLCTDAPLLFHAMPESLRLRVVRRHLGPAPGWFMKDRVVGRFPMHLGCRLRGIERQGAAAALHFESPESGKRIIEADHIIAATGYKPEVSRLPFLAEQLAGEIATVQGAPILDRNFACSVPDLYFVGLASANSFGPLARFAFGAGYTASRLSRHLAGSLRVARETYQHPRPLEATSAAAPQVDRS